MYIENLFPEPVGLFDSFRPLNDSELFYVKKELQSTRSNTSNRTSNNSYVLKSQELEELNTFCLNSVSEFTTAIYGTQIDLCIEQSWLNITKENEYHHVHSHPNSIISGVFYIETSELDNICFYGSAAYDYQPVPGNNRWNSQSWWLPTPQGSLVLFKSNLKHGVPLLKKQGDRISLSFNTFFNGAFGDPLNLSYVSMP